jgi:hypothetical protein
VIPYILIHLASIYLGAMESVRERISRALELPDGTAVVLSASGTDAEYVPLAIARELSLLEQALH